MRSQCCFLPRLGGKVISYTIHYFLCMSGADLTLLPLVDLTKGSCIRISCFVVTIKVSPKWWPVKILLNIILFSRAIRHS